jgi:hypothetical protein
MTNTDEDEATIVQMQDLLVRSGSDSTHMDAARTLWKKTIVNRRQDIQKMMVKDLLIKYPGYTKPSFVSLWFSSDFLSV